MTFNNAINSISPSGTTSNAAKIPRWHGYVYKTTQGMSDTDIGDGKYELRFVKSNGDQYVFTWDGNADFDYTGYIENSSGDLGTGTPASGTTLVMDADLLEALTYDSWETNAQAYYEEQRTTEGAWD